MNGISEWFRVAAAKTAEACGSAWTFIISLLLVVVWGISGPIFNYSDTWQLIINTSTTVITFLVVFLVQNTQNRDSKAIHVKLDELLSATKEASNRFIAAEKESDEDLKTLEREVDEVSEKV